MEKSPWEGGGVKVCIHQLCVPWSERARLEVKQLVKVIIRLHQSLK